MTNKLKCSMLTLCPKILQGFHDAGNYIGCHPGNHGVLYRVGWSNQMERCFGSTAEHGLRMAKMCQPLVTEMHVCRSVALWHECLARVEPQEIAQPSSLIGVPQTAQLLIGFNYSPYDGPTADHGVPHQVYGEMSQNAKGKYQSCIEQCITCMNMDCSDCPKCPAVLDVFGYSTYKIFLVWQHIRTPQKDQAWFCAGTESWPVAGGLVVTLYGKQTPYFVWRASGANTQNWPFYSIMLTNSTA